MFYGAMKKLEKRVELLEKASRRKKQDEGIRILLDCNEEGEDNPDKVYLLCVVPPKSQWKIR